MTDRKPKIHRTEYARQIGYLAARLGLDRESDNPYPGRTDVSFVLRLRWMQGYDAYVDDHIISVARLKLSENLP